MPGDPFLYINARDVERSLKRFDADLAKRTRRVMAEESRRVRDEVRADVVRGPSRTRHAYQAVTSGTRGLIPTLKLDKRYHPKIGWVFFGGIRRRRYPTGVRVDRQPRVAPAGGYWFYPGVRRARRRVEQRVRVVLRESIRAAGLD